ncbi:hypothetical protein CCACVL1_21518 [Corchorus capsularis]|uniref:Uncharacterized protein n=1 Tax=Corchorus capsularis TaxID=210143 RepID=A0A1R3H578_COCAP|nr:hypothetical protein CCACVL1_21518 [Corchorus capsularis]
MAEAQSRCGSVTVWTGMVFS